MKKILVLFIFLAGCGDDDDCYNNYFQNITNYKVAPDAQTPKGARVDTGGYPIDLQKLDERIDKIEFCLQNVMAKYPAPISEWQCVKEKFNPQEKLRRECIIIKLVKPFYSNPNCGEKSNWQFIGYDENSTSGLRAPDELCRAKGIEPTAECPCMWRTAIQDENIIISPPPEQRPNISPTEPPAPYLWEIGRIMTSCNFAWLSPFAKCLSL